jgi:hypothetical protein
MSRNRHGTRPARPIRSAVDSINDSIEPYLKYMIKEVEKEIAEIGEGDFYLGKFRYVYPRPYTLEQYERIYDWMVGWDRRAWAGYGSFGMTVSIACWAQSSPRSPPPPTPMAPAT